MLAFILEGFFIVLGAGERCRILLFFCFFIGVCDMAPRLARGAREGCQGGRGPPRPSLSCIHPRVPPRAVARVVAASTAELFIWRGARGVGSPLHITRSHLSQVSRVSQSGRYQQWSCGRGCKNYTAKAFMLPNREGSCLCQLL